VDAEEKENAEGVLGLFGLLAGAILSVGDETGVLSLICASTVCCINSKNSVHSKEGSTSVEGGG
jgi:hypothetical protein